MTEQRVAQRPEIQIQSARKALWTGVVAALLITLIAPPALGFRVDFASFAPAFLLAALPTALIPYAARRNMAALRSTLELAAIAPLLSVPIMVVTYCAMRLNLPIADQYLSAADRLLGFDWLAMMRFIDSSPALELLLQKGYVAFTPQALLLPMLLSLCRLEARAYHFTLAFLLLGAIASAISIFFPSYGAYVAHGLDGSTLRLIDPSYGNRFLTSFHAVREEADFTLSASNVAGIITFPSVHAGAAVLCAWAAWPSPALRYPVLALNCLMFASALTHGGHFLIDVFGGAAVAALCIRLALSACRERRRELGPLPQVRQPAAL